jgi:hypothetical protein
LVGLVNDKKISNLIKITGQDLIDGIWDLTHFMVGMLMHLGFYAHWYHLVGKGFILYAVLDKWLEGTLYLGYDLGELEKLGDADRGLLGEEFV